MNLYLKRLIDIIMSLTALVILLPVFLLIAVCVKIDSKGRVFYNQDRLTKNGKVFKILKFRTMIENADKLGTGLFNFKGDPRVTKVGRFLRKTSLDELPQLINILIGDMSIVGPRPCVLYELGDYETLNAKFKKRFMLKAGLTGLAQVKGRNDIKWDEKINLDNDYIDLFNNKGILIDIIIIFKTIIKVFKKDSIYEKKIDESLSDEQAAKIEQEEIIRLAHSSLE